MGIANLVSICALLIWQPANPNDTITRLLFPGSTPQNKIFKGLEKLRKLECLKQPTCSPSSLKEAKSGRHGSKDKRRAQKTESRPGQPDNTLLERKEKLARRKEAKLKKEKEEKEKQERDKKEEREKRDREKEENEKFEKEKKERLEKLERKKKAERERKEKERKEKEEKEAAAKKEKEEKEAIDKRERDERRRKEREEKQKQAVKKEIPSDDVKDNDKSKKKLVAIKSKPKDALPKVRKPESNDGAVKARKVMPSKPVVHKSSTPPPSKLKKDESNKKVMETRKAAAARTHRKQPDNEDKNRVSKVSRLSTRKPKEKVASGEERKGDEATVVEKVSKAIASGEIDDSRVVKEDEDDRESIVEKDQIEEMETSPINHHDKDFAKVGDDDEDAELQRIKDEEEEDNQDRVPDIGPSEEKKELDESPPRELDLEKAGPKVAYSHVKTPDEVEDLPEHEVVNPDESMLEEIKSEMSYDLEEKIAKDESEKEVDVAKKDKSDGSIEALKENEEVEVHVEQKLVQPPEMEAKANENKEGAEKDICDNEEEKAVNKLDNEGMKHSCDKAADENQEEETKEEAKARDSFVNNIYPSEGKQEKKK